MKIRATMLTLMTGVVISLFGPVLSAHADVSSVSASASTTTITVSTDTTDGQDPWP
jgi:hypothetical protein